MAWQLLEMVAGAESAEKLAEALLAAGALSVSIEDAEAGTLTERPLFGEPEFAPEGAPLVPLWSQNRVVALLGADAEPARLAEEAARAAGLALPPRFAVAWQEDEDWVRKTQAQFDPIRVSPRLWIVPSWHTPPDPGALNIRLDPGLAFGTGSHPTTRLCLEWLDEALAPGATLLDYGCGSGILAIAAARLGAHDVTAVDIDPQALAAAEANARANEVSIAFALPEELGAAQYDVVVANILSNPLKVLAPGLASRVRPGGHIVLSGILASQTEEIEALYGRWFDMEVPRLADGWALLFGRRRP